MAGYPYESDSRKVGLDPVFGLAATRDSKAMDSARTRNMTYDKRLQSFLKSLEQNASVKHVKIITRQAKTKEMLQKINPDPTKKIVTPIGLSEEQVKTVRLLRRGSLPSMSINELEERLSQFRMERQDKTTEYKTVDSVKQKSKNELTEFRIKRKLYPGISKHKELRTDPIRLVENQNKTILPLYRRKSLVGEAFQRITSCDVIHLCDRNSEDQRRCQSDSDISIKSGSSSTSNGKHQNARTPDSKTSISPRRNTMPDITNSDLVHTKRVKFSKPWQSNGHGPERIQDSLNQNHKFPVI